MKHNPRLHERVAALPGPRAAAPAAGPRARAGRAGADVEPRARAGRDRGPAARLAAAQRRLARRAGRRAADARPTTPTAARTRTKVLTPDTAHGTNPATVTMAGYEVVKVGTNADGGVDLDDLRAKADDDVACLMLTNPNTLGIFDPNIEEIADDRPRRGGDALLRRREPQRGHGHLAPGRHGLRHRALQPAQVLHPAPRRRRPGLGPDRGLRPHRALPAAPASSCAATTARFDLDDDAAEVDRPAARLPGQLRLLRALLRLHPLARRRGPARTPRETAVLNANYLLARLRKLGVADQLPLAFGELCMHEFVLSGAPMKRELRIKTLDLAKRLLDHGFHPPTVYFPLLVDEALLDRADRDRDARDARRLRRRVAEILREAARGPRRSPANAPYTTPVRRLDEAGGGQAPGHPPAAVAAEPPLHLPTDCRRTHTEVDATRRAVGGSTPATLGGGCASSASASLGQSHDRVL